MYLYPKEGGREHDVGKAKSEYEIDLAISWYVRCAGYKGTCYAEPSCGNSSVPVVALPRLLQLLWHQQRSSIQDFQYENKLVSEREWPRIRGWKGKEWIWGWPCDFVVNEMRRPSTTAKGLVILTPELFVPSCLQTLDGASRWVVNATFFQAQKGWTLKESL